MSIKTDIINKMGEYEQLGENYIFYAQFGIRFTPDNNIILCVSIDGIDRKRTYTLGEFIDFDMDEILEIVNSMKQ